MKKCFMFLLCALLTTTSLAAEKIVLTSLDWPPYTGNTLKDQGASVAVAKAAFAAMGYDLVVEFYPWKRAVDLAKSDQQYDGYFPEYYADELKEDFVLSEPMGSGPLGFAELKTAPVAWSTLDDVAAKTIGVVSGYVNTAEFDARMEKGTLKTSATGSDLANLQKLNGKRVDLAVIDQHVLSYLLNTAPELAGVKNDIQFNPTILEDKKLYICFKKGNRGEELAKIFNQGIQKIDVNAIMANHLNVGN
jgi:polar amino acid transport system substrate-binding protein